MTLIEIQDNIYGVPLKSETVVSSVKGQTVTLDLGDRGCSKNQ